MPEMVQRSFDYSLIGRFKILEFRNSLVAKNMWSNSSCRWFDAESHKEQRSQWPSPKMPVFSLTAVMSKTWWKQQMPFLGHERMSCDFQTPSVQTQTE